MVYYEISKLRERALGSASDSSQDTLLGNFGTQADSSIDAELWGIASKNARLTALPPLPFSSAAQAVKDASTDRATALFFLQQHQTDIADRYMMLSKEAVSSYVMKLETDAAIYGVIL